MQDVPPVANWPADAQPCQRPPQQADERDPWDKERHEVDDRRNRRPENAERLAQRVRNRRCDLWTCNRRGLEERERDRGHRDLMVEKAALAFHLLQLGDLTTELTLELQHVGQLCGARAQQRAKTNDCSL